ncbi:InlB B-repeat-containing protein [Ruminiclostridium herbifermentans]|uniref:InlB B-repeat-containing protein n=1 Tax=Ruminiclostridium herbifermentans TaxID=2488810 RepID=A0A4V6ENC1_9FIRM|nr:InlB B-repeat-containing protein [Ruminiclostridium herbifermentans]QNU65658.1 InlB B-repeat-containing protein [Ruminiclostridium herbifermentans]
MSKRVFKSIVILLFLIITVFAVNVNTVYAANITVGDITYNENDFTKLRTFLNQNSAVTGVTNGKAINAGYDENNPATWSGITWTDDEVKRIKTITWDTKSLAGNLDLSGATSMTSLVCSNNKLTSLNVSGNTAMTILSCFSNQLTDLNLSTNKKLVAVNCSFNKLTNIDVSKNTSLTNLCCYSNDIAKLDISKNTALTYFDCNTNKITELDVSNNKKLSTFLCYSNLLTELDLINNTQLTSLDCHSNKLGQLNVDACTKLITLNCSSNQLIELDLSKNTKVTNFSCSDNKLTKIKLILSNNSINLKSHGNGYVEFFIDSSKKQAIAVPFENGTGVSWEDTDKGVQLSNSYTYNLTAGRTYNLQANFAQNVTFNSQGGSEVAAITANYNSTITAPAIPIKDGYIFDGWYKEANCINKWDFAADRVTAEITLYAKWQQISTETIIINGVTYNSNDYTKLKAFLNQESAQKGTSNGKQLNNAYDENNPSTWTGVTWTDGTIKQIKTIYWSYKNLNGRLDLSGAAGLTSLKCYGNKITELITTDDTKLTYIDCGKNMLSSIDISNNTALTYLDCSYNELKYLDVNSNKELTELYCNSNDLISLDVSENEKLTKLNCEYNELISLDTSGSPKLRYLSCSENNLTSLDISKNINLFSIKCSYNQLTEVDISNNLLLGEIEIYGYNLKKFKSELNSKYFYKSLNAIANGNGYLYISNHPVSGEILLEAIPMKGNSFANWTDPVNNSIVSVKNTFRDWKPDLSYNLQANFSQNVIFNSQGGSEVEVKIVNYNNTVEEPQIPTYEGYIFDGWYKEADCINKWDFTTDRVTSETILYAKWISKEILYTVTFNSNGGSAVPNISNINYGESITAPDTPTRDGYDFLGWFKDSNYKNAWDFSKDVVKDNITLYAKWIDSGKTYTVKFNVDGNIVSEINNIKYGDTITAPLPPIKNGFKFKGWYKDSALLDDWDFTKDVVKENITLYAKWAAEEILYTVTFVDGDSTYFVIKNVKAGSTIDEPTAPTKENFAFIGWYKEVDNNKEWDFIRDKVTSDTILYAKWLPSADVTINGITYNGNDYNKLRAFLNQESAVAGKNNGQMINTDYDENDPTTWTGVSWCPGYFDNNEVSYIKEISWESKSLAGKLDLSGAKYLEKLNCSSNQIVELDLGGAERMLKLNCSSNQLAILDVSGANWLYSIDCSYNHINKLDLSSIIDISLNCSSNDMSELYIEGWVYSLKCSGNKFSRINLKYYYLDLISSGNGYMDINYEYAKYANVSAIPNSGYSFVNWTDTRTGNQVSSAATIYISEYDLEMNYSEYTANFTQKVIFDSQGGSEVEAATVNYNSTIKAPNPPTYEGYIFKGWYKEPDCINPWNFTNDVVKENITLYAKWDVADFA